MVLTRAAQLLEQILQPVPLGRILLGWRQQWCKGPVIKTLAKVQKGWGSF